MTRIQPMTTTQANLIHALASDLGYHPPGSVWDDYFKLDRRMYGVTRIAAEAVIEALRARVAEQSRGS
jgi:hypothetical protein